MSQCKKKTKTGTSPTICYSEAEKKYKWSKYFATRTDRNRLNLKVTTPPPPFPLPFFLFVLLCWPDKVTKQHSDCTVAALKKMQPYLFPSSGYCCRPQKNVRQLDDKQQCHKSRILGNSSGMKWNCDTLNGLIFSAQANKACFKTRKKFLIWFHSS